MSLAGPFRVEITCFEKKLFRKRISWLGPAKDALVYCTDSEDALNPPFPAEGKQGISILAGSLASLQQPKVRMLWELERRRGRPSLVIVTRLKGKSFLSSVRDVETALGSSAICPLGFLRRRRKNWDVLDFYSGGESDSFVEAKLRLRRLKQAGWEMCVDRAAVADESFRASYFESLVTKRGQLRDSVVKSFHALKVNPMLGIAGECLKAEHWDSLLQSEPLKSLLQFNGLLSGSATSDSIWTLLSKRELGRELVLLGSNVSEILPGQIFRSRRAGENQPSEFAVARVRDSSLEGGLETRVVRVEVDWRYPPEREIATSWSRESLAPAGSWSSDG